jgi:AcrR family transcriptional regulator
MSEDDLMEFMVGHQVERTSTAGGRPPAPLPSSRSAAFAVLTAAMGVSPPSLYAAFGDKHRLFEEASTTNFRITCEAVDRAAALPTAREAVAKMLDDTARAHTDAATPPGCLMLTEPRLAAQREELHRRLQDRLDRAVHDAISRPARVPTTWPRSWWRSCAACPLAPATAAPLRTS